MRRQIVDLALEEPELSPRELAVRFTDTQHYFVSEASVYRILRAHDLITSPAFVVVKASDAFREQDHAAEPALADRADHSTAPLATPAVRGPTSG